jgi:hypothetical protein
MVKYPCSGGEPLEEVRVKRLTAFALIALLAGCSGGASSVPSKMTAPTAPNAAGRHVQSGGPGTTQVTYYDTYAPVAPCHAGQLTILVSTSFPTTHLSFPAGQGPPLIVSNCNFQTPQYVTVKLGKPAYGAPFLRVTDYQVTVDAPGPAQVTATWTTSGPTGEGDGGDATGTVTFTIGAPSSGGPL